MQHASAAAAPASCDVGMGCNRGKLRGSGLSVCCLFQLVSGEVGVSVRG